MSLVFNKDLIMDYSWLPKGITSAKILVQCAIDP